MQLRPILRKMARLLGCIALLDAALLGASQAGVTCSEASLESFSPIPGIDCTFFDDGFCATDPSACQSRGYTSGTLVNCSDQGGGTFSIDCCCTPANVPTTTPSSTPTSTPSSTPSSTPTFTPIPNGGDCVDPTGCASGNCVDDVCCETICDGPTESCDVEGLRGTCVESAASAPATSGAALLAGLLTLSMIGFFTIRTRRRYHGQQT